VPRTYRHASGAPFVGAPGRAHHRPARARHRLQLLPMFYSHTQAREKLRARGEGWSTSVRMRPPLMSNSGSCRRHGPHSHAAHPTAGAACAATPITTDLIIIPSAPFTAAQSSSTARIHPTHHHHPHARQPSMRSTSIRSPASSPAALQHSQQKAHRSLKGKSSMTRLETHSIRDLTTERQ